MLPEGFSEARELGSCLPAAICLLLSPGACVQGSLGLVTGYGSQEGAGGWSPAAPQPGLSLGWEDVGWGVDRLAAAPEHRACTSPARRRCQGN